MMTTLAGARVGLEPVCAPAVYEARLDASSLIPALIDDIRLARISFVVFLTGAGVSSLLAQAEEIGSLESLIGALSIATSVCRGPKPSAVLRRYDIPVRIGIRPPHTTPELLAGLAALRVEGRGVVVVGDGGRNHALLASLAHRGARVLEIRSYEWQLPIDRAPIEQLVRALLDDRLDAVAFTTQVQVRHLVRVAEDMQLRDAMLDALRHRTTVGSIGPTCTAVLEEFGVTPHVTASPPRMRPLITAIGARLAERRHTSASVIVR